MKTLKLIVAGIILLVTSQVAQAQVSVNVNLGNPPAWGPAGYSAAEYYYIPDVQAYYDVRATQFIYFGNGKWNRSRNLPNQYRNYDLYNGYKVVLNDYHGSRPYANFKNHKVKYRKGYKGSPQRNIGARKVIIRKEVNNRGNNHSDHSKKGKGNKGHGNGKQ
ncbi:hypothetical protein [Flavobacterium sp. W20_MBD1_R3]|uniref:hypothetical protein n=1 Tax=Flavobacterium sp. W20_MBD1_R3 TaxID=3240278 RepID=UPI003F8EB3C0